MMTSRLAASAASMVMAAVLLIPAAASPTATAAAWCGADSVSLTAGGPGSPGDGHQIHFDLILTNTSSQPCSLKGYPGVDLLGPPDPKWGPDYQLPQQAGDPHMLTLPPGASASSRLTFLPDPNGWAPDAIEVTLPNTQGRLKTDWPGSPGNGIPVLRQDGATHPGTYVGPLQLTE